MADYYGKQSVEKEPLKYLNFEKALLIVWKLIFI